MRNSISVISILCSIVTCHIHYGLCQSANSRFDGFIKSYAFDLQLADTTLTNIVYLMYDPDTVPESYTALISTAVCNDGLCQHLQIKLYWDLIGNYLAYDTIAGLPLTKYDHLPFTNEDYTKLHQILKDQNSVLERKSIDELFDHEKARISLTVDATTGATAEVVKNAIVGGALYSTYTLWHIANGSIKNKIGDFTSSIYDSAIQEKLLKSPEYKQQLFGLKMMNDQDFEHQFDLVFDLMRNGNPLVEMFILKKIPQTLWTSAQYRQSLIRSFPELSINGRSLLLNQLSELDWLDKDGLQFLSDQLGNMTYTQLKTYLALLVQHKDQVDSHIKENLYKEAKASTDNAYYVSQFLENYK